MAKIVQMIPAVGWCRRVDLRHGEAELPLIAWGLTDEGRVVPVAIQDDERTIGVVTGPVYLRDWEI